MNNCRDYHFQLFSYAYCLLPFSSRGYSVKSSMFNTSALSRSRLAKICLAGVAILYVLGGVAEFFIAHRLRSQITPNLRSHLLLQAVAQLLIAAGWVTCLALIWRGSRVADITTVVVVLLTALFACNTWINSLKAGFHILQLVEPLVVLPSVVFIIIKVVSAKKE